MKNNIYTVPLSLIVGAVVISLHETIAHTESTSHLIQKRYSFVGTRDNTQALFLRGGTRKSKRGRMGSWESCPHLQNCRCKTKRTTGLDITCNGVTYEHLEADVNALKTKERNIGYFKIRNCDIPKLKDFLFIGIKITYLYITDCKLF